MAVALGVAVLTLAACGGAGQAAGTASTSPAAASRGGTNGGAAFQGTFGTAAAVSPGTLEVQNPASGQVTVTYSASTAFTQTTAASLAAVTAGACVTATASNTGASTGGSATTGPRAITATSVTISQPVNGTCSAGPGGFGARAGGAPSARPSSRPSARPSGAAGRGGAFVGGTVTSVAGEVLHVAAIQRGAGGSSSTTVDDTVTTTASTTFAQTSAATSTALAVGECIAATGPSDTTGAVAASRIAISQPVNGSCAAPGGFGGRRGGTAAPTGSSGG